MATLGRLVGLLVGSALAAVDWQKPTEGLAPACTGMGGFTCVFNLGDRAWRHAPPPGYRGAHEFWLEREA